MKIKCTRQKNKKLNVVIHRIILSANKIFVLFCVHLAVWILIFFLLHYALVIKFPIKNRSVDLMAIFAASNKFPQFT